MAWPAFLAGMGSSAGGAFAGDLVGNLFTMGQSAFNWGLGNKSADQYKSSVRHLRRREYQDMMFSMKKAGLNPILASGATPGHSASAMVGQGSGVGGQGLGSAVAANRQAGVSEKKAPSEIEKALNEAARTKGLITNDQWQRALTDANIKNTNQGTLTGAAQADLYRQQAIKEGASAKEIAAREQNLRADLPNIQSGFGAGTARGIIRELERHGVTPTTVRKFLESAGTSAKDSYNWKNALENLKGAYQ